MMIRRLLEVLPFVRTLHAASEIKLVNSVGNSSSDIVVGKIY
tara:strand:+ start:46 stop:171 length:126 start_codon:yes stop_codon:yes gene_type:complete